MLSRLHEAHQGVVRSQSQARLTVYWPGIDGDNVCCHCQDHLPSNAKEPLSLKGAPERPFQQIAVECASYGGRQFLIKKQVGQMSPTCRKTQQLKTSLML